MNVDYPNLSYTSRLQTRSLKLNPQGTRKMGRQKITHPIKYFTEHNALRKISGANKISLR